MPGRSVGQWVRVGVSRSVAGGLVRPGVESLAAGARARLNWASQSQRLGRCRLRLRAGRVSLPGQHQTQDRPDTSTLRTPGLSLPSGPGEISPPEREKESAMETNRVNGHRHEVSEKLVNRGTFPCRLDMELCACGAKRWVDQDDNVAAPWQLVNLGQTREKVRKRSGAAST